MILCMVNVTTWSWNAVEVNQCWDGFESDRSFPVALFSSATLMIQNFFVILVQPSWSITVQPSTCTGLVSSSSRFTSHCACCKKVLPNETTPHEGYGKPELWWPKASERIRQVQNVEPAQDDRWGELPSLMYDTVLVKTAHVAPSLCHRDTFTLHRTIKKSIFGVQKHHQSHQEPS